MKKSNHHYCVIMAGGIGARFWPMSRTNHPKQFIDILGTGETLIHQTYNRFAKIMNKENIYIVTNEAYKSLVKDQIPGISPVSPMQITGSWQGIPKPASLLHLRIISF